MKLERAQSLYIIYNPEIKATKIGISANVHERMKALSFSAGCKLKLCHVTKPITNALEVESQMHQHFKEFHKLGEWYNIDPDTCIKHSKELKTKQDNITQLYDKGLSISKIANKYNVSRQAIIKRLKKYDGYKEDIKPTTQNRVINLNDFERIGKNKYKHKKTNKEHTIKFRNGQFEIV